MLRRPEIRDGVQKSRERELVMLRRKLEYQLACVKTREQPGGAAGLARVLNGFKDMEAGVSVDQSKLTLEDMMAEDPDAGRKACVKDCLNK